MKHDTVSDYLISTGWKYVGSCNCGGTATRKFTFNEFKLRVKAKNFMLSSNILKSKKYSIDKIKETTDEIIQAYKKTTAS